MPAEDTYLEKQLDGLMIDLAKLESLNALNMRPILRRWLDKVYVDGYQDGLEDQQDQEGE